MMGNKKTRSGAGTPKRANIEIKNEVYISVFVHNYITININRQGIFACIESLNRRLGNKSLYQRDSVSGQKKLWR
jgi:hypothetical protein